MTSPGRRHKSHRLLLVLLACQAAYATGSEREPGTTEHGQPDLQGTWDFGTKTPFQRPAALGEKRAYTEQEAVEFENKAREANLKMDEPVDLTKDAPVAGGKVGEEADAPAMERRHDLTRVNGEYRTSIVIDPPTGQLPKRKEFVDHFGQIKARGFGTADGPDTLDLPTRCMHPLPVPTIYPMPWSALLQIVQTKDYVVLHTEMIHDARIVRLNGTHAKHSAKTWMGDSVGHFEGNTLVVRTINFRPEQSYASIMPMSEDFELTERFTRVSEDELVYSFTVVDPKAYTSPFTAERTLKRAAPRDRILEFACHEGNYSMAGILAGVRKQEEDAARGAAERLHAPAALAQDLDQFLQTVMATHPDVEYTADLRQLRAKAAEISAGLKAPMNVRAAWAQFARLNPPLRDAHMGLQYPVTEFSEYRKRGGAVLPLAVYIDAAGRVRIAESAESPASVAAHEEIVAINGQSMQEFLGRAMPLMRGETANIQRLVLARNFAAYYWTLNGEQSEYRAAIRDARGQLRVVVLPATPDTVDAAAPSQAFRYERIRPGVGYLQVRSFDIRLAKPFESFLAETFADLKSRGVRNLIIDLRDNPGGAHELSDRLLQYLISRPVRQASSLRARIVDANRSIAPAAVLNAVVTIEHDEWLQPEDESTRFAGETVLMIGPRTYSQAIVFSATFQDFGLGRVVGQPTDGWANQTGQVHMTPLTHTGLIVAAPLYIIYRPSGERQPGGVQPDVLIAEDPLDPDAIHTLLSGASTDCTRC